MKKMKRIANLHPRGAGTWHRYDPNVIGPNIKIQHFFTKVCIIAWHNTRQELMVAWKRIPELRNRLSICRRMHKFLRNHVSEKRKQIVFYFSADECHGGIG